MPINHFELQQIFTIAPTSSPEEQWNSVRKCKKCFQFYTLLENNSPTSYCRYHTGKYTDSNRSKDGIFIGWSCCNMNPPQGVDPHDAYGKGCKQTKYHIEDLEFTKIMNAFPYDANANSQQQFNQVQTQFGKTETGTPTGETKNPDSMPEKSSQITDTSDPSNDDEKFFVHHVSISDTLAGISIRYKIPKEVIRKVNKMQTDQVIEKKILYIPKVPGVDCPSPNPVNTRSLVLSSFMKATNCDKAEASYYLDTADWDEQAAIKLWKDDMLWQKNTIEQKTLAAAYATPKQKQESYESNRFC